MNENQSATTPSAPLAPFPPSAPVPPSFPNGFSLGLDLGANSVGWAMVNDQPAPGQTNIFAGVRVFPEGTNRQKGKETPRNLERRLARQTRRQLDRRSRRKRLLAHVLREAGLDPLVHTRHVKTGGAAALPDPYQLRKKGLDEPLALPEFGRVLMHLNQRRGFKSNAKTDDPKETGKVKEGIAKLDQEMKEAGARTLGEYMASLNPHEHRIRNRYTHREMFEKEFDLLWRKQSEFQPAELTPALREKAHEAIFHQRPLKPMDSRIGQCELEPGEPRCPRASWYAHQIRLLQEVNNLRVFSHVTGERELTPTERRALVEKLQQSKELKTGAIRKMLGLHEHDSLNFEDTRRDKIEGNLVQWGIAKTFKQYKKDPEKIQWLCREVFEAFLLADPADFEARAKEEWKLAPEEIEAIGSKKNVPQTPGYAAYSRKAIEKLIPHLEQGLPMHVAREQAGYKDKDTSSALAQLPPTPENINNPVVRRALAEARKVVNAILREYGAPSRVVVEFARETKGTIRQRAEQLIKNNDTNRYHEMIKGKLNEAGIGVNHDSILKYKLWEECDRVCPYTGKSISFEALFHTGEYQIEHIFPYDRSFDNGFMNLTLCDEHENRSVKGNRTPFDAYHDDADKYEQIRVRVGRLRAMPYEKKRRFLAKEIPDDFTRRQLQDTSYMARELREYLKSLGAPVHTTRGPITAELRYGWGLNSILSPDGGGAKSRDDHRHHAVDAIVIALTTQKHHQALAHHFRPDRPTKEKFASPWDGFSRDEFRQEVNAAIQPINVSYRAERRVAGELNKDTNYGPTRKEGVYVHRVQLASIKPAQVKRIIDGQIRALVMQRLAEKGVALSDTTTGLNEDNGTEDNDEPAGKGKIPKEAFAGLRMSTRDGRPGPLIKKVRIWEKSSVAIPLKDRDGHVYRYVEPGNNHHVAIFEYVNTKGETRRAKQMVTRFEAAQRRLRGEPVIVRVLPDKPEAKFLFSLSINEMVLIPDQDGKPWLFRVQKISDTGSEEGIYIVFRLHTAATIGNDSEMLRFTTLRASSFNAQKVVVDPLGRIRAAHD